MIFLDVILNGNSGCRRGVQKHPGDNVRKPHWRFAFTLIELLVVISIIAVLMGILLPTLGRAREQAKCIKCRANMRQMGLAQQVYILDYDYRLPPSSCHITDPNGHWLRILAKFTKEDLLFQCPSDRAKDFVDWDRPILEQQDCRYSSYAVNALLDPVHYRYGARHNRYNCTMTIKHPQHCIWIIEAPDKDNFNLADHIHPESWEGSIDYAKQFIAYDRHVGTSNYLFADGHVEKLKIEETYQWPGVCYWYPETAPKWPKDIAE